MDQFFYDGQFQRMTRSGEEQKFSSLTSYMHSFPTDFMESGEKLQHNMNAIYKQLMEKEQRRNQYHNEREKRENQTNKVIRTN